MIPWSEWAAIIQPFYYKGENGNKPYPPETMLRIHVLQNLYDISGMGVSYEVIDSISFSTFYGVTLATKCQMVIPLVVFVES